MFMIVMIHVLGYGGVRDTTAKLSAVYNTAWLMNTAAYSAVNCYALLSGYAGLNGEHKYSRLIAMWFRVVFWTVTLTAFFSVAIPGSVGVKEWLKAIFPVMGRQYWYFTAYCGLFVFMPALDEAVRSLAPEKLKASVAGMICVFSVMQTFFHRDVFATNSGFSALWLMVMYVLGASLRRFGTLERISSTKALVCYAAAVVCVWGSKLGIEALTLKLLGAAKGGDMFTRYTSPAVILEAVCLLAVFSRLSLPSWMVRTVKIFAPLTLSVYLIHLNRLLLNHVLKDAFIWITFLRCHEIIIAVILATMLIYLCCSCADLLRQKLFIMLRIGELSSRAEYILGRTVNRLWLITRSLMSQDSGKSLRTAGRN